MTKFWESLSMRFHRMCIASSISNRCDQDKIVFIKNFNFFSGHWWSKFLKQASPEFVEPIQEGDDQSFWSKQVQSLLSQWFQEGANGTGESEIEPTFYNHLNRVRVSVTTPEHSLHRHTLTSELRSGLFHDKFHSHAQIGISSQLSLELHQLPIGYKNPKKAKPTKPNEAKLSYHWMMVTNSRWEW